MKKIVELNYLTFILLTTHRTTARTHAASLNTRVFRCRRRRRRLVVEGA